MTTFVDTNVLIYLLDPSSRHHQWAIETVTERRTQGPLVICDIVYSEFSVTLDSVVDTDKALATLSLERLRFTNDTLFRAGKAFAEYRRRGGQGSNVLSDFLIGAQAEVESAPLLTNNPRDFHSYFPKLEVIEP
jgi:predicted nucleic acid-binding protein